MAIILRLSEAEAQALRRKAGQDGRSMLEVARAAIAEYVSDRPAGCGLRSSVRGRRAARPAQPVSDDQGELEASEIAAVIEEHLR